MLARAASPSLAVDRATLLRARSPPLRVVHMPPERPEVNVGRRLDVSVGRQGAEEVAVRALGLLGAPKQLALLLGRRGGELVRIDASGKKAATVLDVAPLVGGALGKV